MEISTIGFTRTSAQSFFDRLASARVTEVWDVRLNKVSQLAGFAKRDDLGFFLDRLCGIAYREVPELAPSPELLTAYRSKALSWQDYSTGYLELIRARRIESRLEPRDTVVALLCSEETPVQCHRRLAAEYLQRHWPSATIRHL